LNPARGRGALDAAFVPDLVEEKLSKKTAANLPRNR
jgi:hypothetical protein